MLIRAHLFLAALSMVGCSSAPALTDAETRTEACQALEKAYLRTYGTILRPFALNPILARWEQESVPLTQEEMDVLPDTARVLMELYTLYFDPPARRAQLGGEDYNRKEIARPTRYTVIPSVFRYSVVRDIDPVFWSVSEDNEIRRDSIVDFRPAVNAEEHILYLTPDKRTALDCFLGTGHWPLGADGLMSPSVAYGESRRRASFLRGYLPLIHGHWGGYWHVETQPIVTYAEVNEALTEAVFHLRLGYQGGHALYRRDGRGWSLAEHKLTWIE